MPMYEFDCSDCHKTFEELVLSGTDPDAVSCPACTSKHVAKRLSAFAVGASSSFGSDASASAGSCASGGCCSGGSCGF
ncbi:MAG: zinc ribbon domain-containing protein [Deltaproteobacteria bacterium]|nr:zinc ribbon domain-containing protein [Deltaproteobacteria bacterium]